MHHPMYAGVGDKRALTFCCPPVKPCPITIALEEADLTPQDYIEIKEEFARKTRLGEGQGTCFGSLVWCCKLSKPCPQGHGNEEDQHDG